MSRFVIISAVLLISLGVAQVDTAWVRHFQYSNSYPNQYMSATRQTAIDGAGNVFIGACGQYSSASYDFIVTKYAPDGNMLWSVARDGGGDEIAYGLAVDNAGAVYVTGRSSLGGSSWVMTVKWNAGGVFQWESKIAGDSASSDNYGMAIAVNSAGVYVSGSLSYRASRRDFSLLRLDPVSGASSWIRTISRSSTELYEVAQDVILDEAGAVYVCGQTGDSTGIDATVAKYSASGTLSWARYYDSAGAPASVRRLSVRGVVVAATGYIAQTGNYNALTLAYSTSGTLLWARGFNGSAGLADYGYDVGLDISGNVLVAGMSYGTTSSYDMLALKYTSSGTLSWARTYDGGAQGSDCAYGLEVDSAGSVTVCGYACPMPAAPTRITCLKYSSSGILGWAYMLNQTSQSSGSYAYDIVAHGADVYLAGMAYWGYPRYYDPTLVNLREVPDVGVTAIAAPTGMVSPGSSVAPNVALRNFSLLPVSFACRFEIGDIYAADTLLSLGPGGTASVQFPNWTAGEAGNWVTTCCVHAGLDWNRANDTLRGSVRVTGPAIDVGVRAIVTPSGDVRYGASFTPTARWRNFGAATASFRAYYFIDRNSACVYSQSRDIAALEANGRDTAIQFTPWVGDIVGYYTVRCSTVLTGDSNRLNDTFRRVFGVVNQPPGVWDQLEDVPASPSGRPVSKGGALTGAGAAIYALKGNKTSEFCVYDISTGHWRQLPAMPVGYTQKPVGPGSGLASDGNGLVYAMRGNKTGDFYRYDPVIGWTQLAAVPPGASRKLPKGGAALEFAVVRDTAYVYLLKGSGTSEFYRYSTMADTWLELPAAPAGTCGRAQYKDGSTLVCSDSVIYCMKGKYNEIFVYDLAHGCWRTGQLLLPLTSSKGARKKAKSGAALAWGPGVLAATKAGNTTEFWYLEAADSVWREFPDVPLGLSGRKLKDGAGLRFVDGSYYLLKGAKTLEFWRYQPAAGDGPTSDGTRRAVPPQMLALFPSLTARRGLVRLHGIGTSRASVTVADINGRIQVSMNEDVSDERLDIPVAGLRPGVYYVTVRNESGTRSAKLVVTE